MTTVRVEAPARLHLGMLDASGEGARRFGGLGAGVVARGVVVEGSAGGGDGEGLVVEGPDADRARRVAERCLDALGGADAGGGVRVQVVEAIPPHVGLGSGTKLALAAAAALAALRGASPDPPALARLAGRGARSAVGLWTFALGGLVVEGGRRRGSDDPAPLLVRHGMPEDWRCVLAIPAAEPGLSGAAEEAAFEDLRPDPERSARIAQIVLTALLPALVERDLAEFGGGLTELQRLVGEAFAPVQGGPFRPRSGALVETLLRHGAAGAGQSSWGPAVYGIAGGDEQARELAAALEPEVGAGGRAEVVRFADEGARIGVVS